MMAESEKLITDEELRKVFRGTDFGGVDHRELLNASVLKILIDYHCGHTITVIMTKLGLIGKTGRPTKKGIALVRESFGHLLAVSG